MKPTAGVINTSFGGVLDEVELINLRLQNQFDSLFAALDVFDNEPHPEIQILMQDKISLSPHIADFNIQKLKNTSTSYSQQIINFDKN